MVARTLHLPAPARLTVPRHDLGSIVMGPADIGFVVQDAAYGRRVPEVPSRWRADAVAGEPDDDLAHRDVPANVVIENPAHDRGLGLEHLQMRRALAGPGNSTESIRHLPEDHFAGPGPPQLATPVALGNLRALILGNHALHLGQQACLRIVLEMRRVMEANRHAVARQLVKNDGLVCVHARQAIRRQAPHAFKESGLRRIAQCIKTRSVQACAGPALVRMLGHQLVALAGHAFTQERKLRAYGAAGFLGVGRDPGVDCDSHRRPVPVSLCPGRDSRITS